ncbi:uncharacterized protein KIAA2026 homolog [Protopterus annectens]|uniref:uncharacterized protein KIAA2026 homolog n=1 Tax=Protopterus annectens TaxID=7888 RepID=UPI001CFA586F|nr:uncharacterized protein KIAA2026 homolog [Protopterus annectens]
MALEEEKVAAISKDCNGLENDKGMVCFTTRRRSSPRNLGNLSAGSYKSLMVQNLRLEEQQKAKEEKRLREQEKKDAKEAIQKEIEIWEKNLLAQTEHTRMETMWEIPAIGHFLCLAQCILNLPEVIFYELERCLLMPQCSTFLAKIMTSLLSLPHRRATLHRRPTLSYKEWEAALRRKVLEWYTVVGQAENPDNCAEQLGLCHQFFQVLGESSPLEEKPFHELSFYQKTWLLKGLCDFVYETQKEVQDAVLGQPIHECREVILGYDSQENAFIHFPQFCGADIRIYKQRPLQAPKFPIPSIKIKSVPVVKLEKVELDCSEQYREYRSNVDDGLPVKSLVSIPKQEDCMSSCASVKEEVGCHAVPLVKKNCDISSYEASDAKEVVAGPCKENCNTFSNPLNTLGYEEPLSPGKVGVVGNGDKNSEFSSVKVEESRLNENALKTCKAHLTDSHSDQVAINCHRTSKGNTISTSLMNQKQSFFKMHMKKKKKKKKIKDVLNKGFQTRPDGLRPNPSKSSKPDILRLNIKKKLKHKKHKSGKKSVNKKANLKKKNTYPRPSAEPQFQLVCTNLEELRKLILKTEEELKDLERNRKKSGKWYNRRKAVKELHSTLRRLLNELLPWEPKLIKAFQRNRARLKKDYDDFVSQLDHDKFDRIGFASEENDGETDRDFPKIETHKLPDLNEEMPQKDHQESGNTTLSEMDRPVENMKLLKRDVLSNEVQKTFPKHFKRSLKQSSCTDECLEEYAERKKIKLSIDGITDQDTTGTLFGPHSENWQSESKTELSSESAIDLSSSALCAAFVKGTKPAIQALLAKNDGNKVTLTSHQLLSLERDSEKQSVAVSHSKPTSVFCHAATNTPVQMLCKMPVGSRVPVSPSDSPFKIQVQPITDSNTGEKVMQQVVFLPPKFIIQHKEAKSESDCQSDTSTSTFNSPTEVSIPSSVAVQISPFANTATSLSSSPVTKNISSSSKATSLKLPSSAASLSLPTVKVAQCETAIMRTGVPNPTAVVSAPANFTAADQSTSALQTDHLASLPPLPSVLTLSKSAGTAVSVAKTKPQQAEEFSETKQELKTICIRDSQSILVRTRGGNTGVVKVQTNPDQNLPNSLTPNPVFTFTPQFQTFLVSKSAAVSSTLSTTTATRTSVIGHSPLPHFVKSPASVSIPVISGNLNRSVEKIRQTSVTHAAGIGGSGQPSNRSTPVFFSSPTSSSSYLSVPTSSSINVINMAAGSVCAVSSGSAGPTNMVVNQNSSVQSESKRKKLFVTQSESALPAAGSLELGTSVPKVMLATASSVVPSSSSAKGSMAAGSSAASLPPQKLMFFNPPVTAAASSIVAESLKQALPFSIGKTYLRTTEQKQMLLIPHSMGAPVIANSSSTISQVKEVKIGLNIGQAIVNTGSGIQKVQQIHMLPNLPGKVKAPLTSVPLPAATAVSFSSSSENQNKVACSNSGASGYTVKSNVSLGSGTLKSRFASTVNEPAAIGENITSRITTASSSPHTFSGTGNTVALSTVKTGHLASSVLISTTQPALSLPQLPVPTTAILSAATVTASTTQTSVTFPCAGQNLPLLKGQPQTLPLTKSSENTTCISKSHILPTSCLSTSSSVIPAVALMKQSTSAKPVQVDGTFTSVSSTVQVGTAPTTLASQGGVRLSEPNLQQKIVLNTSTRLAPGTHIMINNTRFVVPTPGLGAGSHILFISNSAKQGTSAVVNSQQIQKNIPLGNDVLSVENLKQSLKSTTQVVNSVSNAHTVPIPALVPQVNNFVIKTPVSLATATVTAASMFNSQQTFSSQTIQTPFIQCTKSQLPVSSSSFPSDTTIEKLLVSPEGAILNSLSTAAVTSASLSSVLSPAVAPSVVSSNTVFPSVQVPLPAKCDTKTYTE